METIKNETNVTTNKETSPDIVCKTTYTVNIFKLLYVSVEFRSCVMYIHCFYYVAFII